MSNPIEALFGAGLLPRTDFPPESRYHGVPVRTIAGPDGRQIAYLARRFSPDPDRFATLSVQIVPEGQRLDQAAARLIGDPEQFWALCDANGAIWPEELEVADGRIRVTLPADVPAPEDQL
ncbi:hypothetical protein ACFB49_00520 [Sphingomonas sp. DBB INV C78]|uniref:LysM domain-containing protein n=1 Tax=Sphingomonas sp. DBB INV C78 TaxID=3349434 RepID=UPI0036D40C28